MSLSSPTRSSETPGSVRAKQRLESSLRAMASQLAAASAATTRLVTVDLPDPIVDYLVAGGLASLRTRATVTWERPAQRFSVIGLGAAARLTGDRTSTLSDAMGPIVEMASSAVVLANHRVTRPRFLGGGRFDPGGEVRDPAWASFGGWQFVVPCFLLATEDGDLLGSCTMSVHPGETVAEIETRLAEAVDAASHSEPMRSAAVGRSVEPLDSAEWQARVASAIEEIEAGRYKKVVLARRSNTEGLAGEDIGDALGKLAKSYGNCYVFKFHTPDSDWLGATPELLVGLKDGAIRAASLAGSRPRKVKHFEDRQQVDDLFADAKERAEHEYVATALRESLAPICDDLSAPADPEVMTLPNIHHLYTPFEGHVASGTHILDLVAAVHPTPAVGGWPRDEAMAAINRLERLDRGWYAGPIGWIDFAGEGEFAVALRAGLVSSTEAILFAGAGIVAGSVPAQELAETETKLRPLRDALGAC